MLVFIKNIRVYNYRTYLGLEPPTFIGLFENWNHNLLREHRSFEALQMTLQDQEPVLNNPIPTKLSSDFHNFVKYPLKVLRNEAENLPKGVDVERKEMHLTFDDFVAIFKMDPAEFEKLPAWRRQRLKQAVGLF